jgi:hypothetical protein
VEAYQARAGATPQRVRTYPGVGAGTTRAVPIAIGPGQQPGMVLVDDREVITVLNAFTGNHTYQQADPRTEPLLTDPLASGYVKDPNRCDLLTATPNAQELRRYSANDEEGVLWDGTMTFDLLGVRDITTVRAASSPVDWVVLLRDEWVTCLRVDTDAVEEVTQLPLTPLGWTSIVAGRFTTSGGPCLLVYAASTGAWQIVEVRDRLVLGESGSPGTAVAPMPIWVTDLVPGQFGGQGLTDLFLWRAGSRKGSIVTRAFGSDVFTELTPWWDDWTMSILGPPVAVR